MQPACSVRASRRTLRLLLPLVVVSVLAACGKDDKKAATQVAATVNSKELSVHQINFLLSRSGATATTPEQTAALRRNVLDRLIDQQLAVDEALEKKLDRSPDVVMALEAARREVLARAYLEQVGAGIVKPTDDEVKKYFNDNPALFSARKVYALQEITVPLAAGMSSQLRDLAASAKSMEDIVAALRARNVQFNAGSATRAAEQLPLDVLPKLHALKDGQITMIEVAGNSTVVRLVSSQAAPVAEAVALPRIQQFLSNQRAGEAAARDIKRLKEKAKITYAGDFAAGASAAPAAAPATAPAVPAATPAPPAAPATGAPPTDNNFEKGLRGLK